MEYSVPSAIPKKTLVINDLTGFGRCSLAVILPIISAMHVQACPVAASVFSSHMAFPSYYHKDLTDGLSPCFDEYDKLGLAFDGIYCGFLNSPRQFRSIQEFIESQSRSRKPLVVIDPVLGDHGRPYRIVTDRLCREMKQLIPMATILTPNLTESCMLTDTPFPQSTPDGAFLQTVSEKLLDMGISRVAITGIVCDACIMNYCAEQTASGIRTFVCKVPSGGESRPGTGDIFASILTADALHDVPFETSVKKAADFIRICVNASARAKVPVREGVIFENYLSVLWNEY